jgi:hypothetical protein
MALLLIQGGQGIEGTFGLAPHVEGGNHDRQVRRGSMPKKLHTSFR